MLKKIRMLGAKPLPVMEELVQGKARTDAELKAAQAALTVAKAGQAKVAEVQAFEKALAEKKNAAKNMSGKLLALKESNIHKTMLIFGICFLIIVTLLSQLMVTPPVGYNPPDVTTAPGTAPINVAAAINIGPGEMLKTPLFYLLWIMFAFGAGAGLMIIGSVTTTAKLGKIEAGFILVALLAVGNASGRIIAGMLSDKIGRLWTMLIIFIFQAVLMMVLRTGLTDMAAFIAISMLLGFNYGSCLSVFPSAVKDNFGLKNFGVNYGLVFTAGGVAGSSSRLSPGSSSRWPKRPLGPEATTRPTSWLPRS